LTDEEAAAQAELREIARELSTLCLRLDAMHDRLPEPLNAIAMLLGEEENNVAMEVRGAIECVLNDDLRPAIRDLQAAALYTPKGEEA
jgi:hypothetical protein